MMVGSSRHPLLHQGTPAPLPGVAHQLRQHGQAFPQAEEAVDRCCVVVPAKLKGHPGGFGSACGRAVLHLTAEGNQGVVFPPLHPAQRGCKSPRAVLQLGDPEDRA